MSLGEQVSWREHVSFSYGASTVCLACAQPGEGTCLGPQGQAGGLAAPLPTGLRATFAFCRGLHESYGLCACLPGQGQAWDRRLGRGLGMGEGSEGAAGSEGRLGGLGAHVSSLPPSPPAASFFFLFLFFHLFLQRAHVHSRVGRGAGGEGERTKQTPS